MNQHSRHNFILLASINHILWSFQSVTCRYLQVYARPLIFDGQGILTTTKAASAIILFVFGPWFCPQEGPGGGEGRRGEKNEKKDNGEHESVCYNSIVDEEDKTREDSSNNDTNAETRILNNEERFPLRDDGNDVADVCNRSRFGNVTTTTTITKQSKNREPSPLFRTKILYAAFFGVVATCRASLNIASSKFTLSYNITTINSLTPILVSIGDATLLGAKLPRLLWPCVIMSCLGCVIIGLSQSPYFVMLSSSSSVYLFTMRDTIGCSLQFTSMCFSAMARLLMKRTEHILTRDEMVQTNNICNTILPLIYTLVTNPNGWLAFRYITIPSLFAWLILTVLVYTIGSTGQMSLVRTMGPGMYTSLSALRVLGSVFLSAVWLNEPVRNWLEWTGLVITMITMTVYTIASSSSLTSVSHGTAWSEDTDKKSTSSMEMKSSSNGQVGGGRNSDLFLGGEFDMREAMSQTTGSVDGQKGSIHSPRHCINSQDYRLKSRETDSLL